MIGFCVHIIYFGVFFPQTFLEVIISKKKNEISFGNYIKLLVLLCVCMMV